MHHIAGREQWWGVVAFAIKLQPYNLQNQSVEIVQCCLAAPDQCYVLLVTIDTGIIGNGVRKLDHCDAVGSEYMAKLTQTPRHIQQLKQKPTMWLTQTYGTDIIHSRSVYGPDWVPFVWL